EEAIKCYDKVLEIDPESVHALYNKGNALYNIGNYEDAIECYDKALEIDPNSDIIKHNLKVAREKLEELERSV
ncbi:MAG: tetratricopeptide repeat protein, partial [Methanosarcinales archaeon]